MHKIWLMIDPKLALIGLAGFLLALALSIHYILLVNSSYYDFLQGPPISPEAAAKMTPLPSGK
ncbi:light-harvesting antenna LH1, alpha subunit [Thiocystis violacea]|uniref:light-harvesting antenna LH1, alpha subunit n=1 Tax=Thiocystis violacea TaxID=13725 RepID=UPI001905A23C|nr:light-harvesting antenna LH1, alpha subunit [Thiocystis violacea]MBK1716616.1 light-harvesting protein [Thiocystis violacea]